MIKSLIKKSYFIFFSLSITFCTGNEVDIPENTNCADISRACTAYCDQYASCLGGGNVPLGCVSSCENKLNALSSGNGFSNIFYKCVIKEGCNFFNENNPCLDNSMNNSHTNCENENVDLSICDEERCCGTIHCQPLCEIYYHGSFRECSYSNEKGRDVCWCG